MNFNLLPYAIFWAVLALRGFDLIVYRKSVSSREDDSIHLEGTMPAEQVALAHRLALIDRWGKIANRRGCRVWRRRWAAIYMYQVWNNVPTY